MLACLVLIPAIALFGKSLPDLAMKIFEDVSKGAPAPANDGASETLGVDGSEALPPLVVDDGSLSVPVSSDRSGMLNGAVPASCPPMPGVPSSAEMPAGYQTPVDAGQPGYGGHATTRLPAMSPPQEGYLLGATHGFAGELGPSSAASPSSEVQSTGGARQDPSNLRGATFSIIEERLRDLGAVSYKLETWGERGRLYRFQCEMVVNGNSAMTRHFEATAGNAVLAMHKVLVEVQEWQASR
jgi:hypothetical protein